MNTVLEMNEQSGIAGVKAQDETGHVDLRPPIVNKPQVGPGDQLNVLDGKQAGEVAAAVEDEGRSWMPGQAITSDRQYRSVMSDFNLMSVDAPEYRITKQSLEEYWDKRGLGRGHVAAVADVKRGRAYQLMAELGDGTELDPEQVRDVENTLGKGVVNFYKKLSQEEKDAVLVDGYVESFVGGAPALSRVFLAERLGLDTDEAHVMAAELRRQAGVGRARREQVKKDLGEVWGEMMTATGSGKEFSLDPRDHQGRSPEFLAGAASLAESQRMAAAFIKEMAYGEDGRSPHAQGMQTGIDGLRTYGYSKYEEGRWVVELAKLHRKDERAYELAIGAIAGLVDYQKGKENVVGRMENSFVGMANEGLVHGSARWLESGMMDFLQSAGLVKKGEEKFSDPHWTARVNKVAQDVQQIRMGQYQGRSENGFVNFMEEASGVFGGAVPFIATGGLTPMLETQDTTETKYLARGVNSLTAKNAAYGEGLGMWATNIWGLGKGGKLVGKAYDKLMNWAGRKVGMKGLLGRALETDRFWGRGPLFVGLEGGVLHTQTIIEPYARSVASNMFTGGNGKSWDEADAEAREAMTWRNFLVALPMSLLLGYGRYAQNSPFRAAAVANARIRGVKLECADSPEAMKGLKFEQNEIKAILNAENEDDKLRLFDIVLQDRVRKQASGRVAEPIGVLMTPDVPLVQSLMEQRAIPRAEVVKGKLRVYDVAAVEIAGKGDRLAEEGEKSGETRKEKGYVEMDLETGNRFLTAKVQEWAVNQDFTLRNAAMENAAVGYFVSRCNVDFKSTGTVMSYNALRRMADDALMRVSERNKKPDWKNKDDLSDQQEDVFMALLPNNFRDRVEVALKRGDLSRGEGMSGDVTDAEVTEVMNREGVHASAFNYELECGKRVIRYYEGDTTFLDLVEEMAELYVKGEMSAGRELSWFARNLLETQNALKEQGVKGWKLADEGLLSAGAEPGKREMAVYEGMSKLMKAAFMGEYKKKDLPSPVRRFLEILEALSRKVAEMAGLAGAFRKAVDDGAVQGDFAAFVYDAVGADFAQSRSDLVKRKFEKQLQVLKGKPENMLEDYAFHLIYAKRYGLNVYRQQVMEDLLAKDRDPKDREFAQAGIDFFQLMKGATLEEAEMVLNYLQTSYGWKKRDVSFSVKEKLNEMGKDAGKRKVMDFVDMVVSSGGPDKTSLGVVEYRAASAREIADIKTGLGIDVTGMVHEFSADAITHALKKHGHDGRMGKDQLDLTKDDVKLVLDVLDGYDRMEFKQGSQNKSSVAYVKAYPHGEVFSVEQVIETAGRRSKKPRLTFRTAWVKAASTGGGTGTPEVYTPQRRKDNVANTEGDVKGEQEDGNEWMLDAEGSNISFSIRTKEPPKNTGIGYKVFYQKDGKLYPPMVANPDGKDTPVGVWLDADEGVRAGVSKTGRPRVKAGGKGTQGGSGTLAYRPGWHLGEIPYALQFNRKNPQTGERDLFPADFVWAEVEYAADHDYQQEAMSHGINPSGKFQHSLAGLPRIPKDGFYRYRTNPNPQTDPWIITGSMKVRRVLSKSEVDGLVRKAGKVPQMVEQNNQNITFSVREDLLGDMKRQIERTRSESVREYWRHVVERVEKEGRALDSLFRNRGMNGQSMDRNMNMSDARVKIAEARSIMKVAISTLPERVRWKLAGQEKLLDYLMSALETGRFSFTDALTEKELAAANRKMDLHPEFFDELIGQKVEDLLPKVYQRCGEVIDLYVRDELLTEVRKMITENETVIDEKTRKFKVSRLGAGPTEWLRRVIKPAVFANAVDVEPYINELSSKIAAIEEKLRKNEFWTGALDSGEQEMDENLLIAKQKLCGELNWWVKYSAAGSSDVNRMLDIHEAVSTFISRSAEVWAAHLAEKVGGWKVAGMALRDELPDNVTQKSIHQAQMEVQDLGVDSETGRVKRGVVMGWLDNPVRFLQRLCDGPGTKFFTEFKKEFLGAIDRGQAVHAEEVEKMNRVLKKLLGTKSDRKVNEFLLEWDTANDLGLSLSEKGVRKTKLTIDQATKLLERRENNPWWGVDMYTQEAIDLLKAEYEAWGRGENRARKWFEVEEWYDMAPQPMSKLSRDQALFVLMCMDQPNVYNTRIPKFVTSMRKRGWNDSHKQKLEEYVGEMGMALKTILFEEYALAGDKIRPLYEDRYGVPFSKRRDYSPLRWMVAETKEDSELAAILGDDGMVAVGRSDGFLSTRVIDHKRYLNTTEGALSLFWKHHANAMNWVHTQEIVERYKGILSDPATAQKLMVNVGGLDYRGFQVLINRLEHGGRDAIAELDAAEKVKNEIMNARALSVIMGQVTSYMKQTTAVFNALHGCDLSISEWIHGLARVASGKSVLSVKELYSSDLFQARKDGFMYSVLLGYKKQLGGRVGLLEEITNQSGKIFGLLDSGSNAVSFAAAFDHYFRQGIEQGMTKPEGMEYARDVIEEGLSTAQPINWSQMPKMLEKTKGIFSAEWFLMSETLQRSATVMHYLTRGNTRLAVRSWLIQGVAMQALGYLVNNVMRPGGDDDERRNPLNYLPGIVLGPLNGVPFLGNLTDAAVDRVCGWLGLEMQSQTAVMGSQVDLTMKDLERLANILEADSWRDVKQQSRSVATLASLAAMFGAWRNPRGGVITSASLGVATLANYLKHLAGMAEKWIGE